MTLSTLLNYGNVSHCKIKFKIRFKLCDSGYFCYLKLHSELDKYSTQNYILWVMKHRCLHLTCEKSEVFYDNWCNWTTQFQDNKYFYSLIIPSVTECLIHSWENAGNLERSYCFN